MSYDGTIEAGKLYRSRAGQQIRVYATDGYGSHPIHAAIKRTDGWESIRLTLRGHAINIGHESHDDIVGLWVDPPEPKWRPFREDELLKLVGRVVQCDLDGKPNRMMVARAFIDWVYLTNGTTYSTAKLLAYFQLVGADGETLYKCGVLEDGS